METYILGLVLIPMRERLEMEHTVTQHRLVSGNPAEPPSAAACLSAALPACADWKSKWAGWAFQGTIWLRWREVAAFTLSSEVPSEPRPWLSCPQEPCSGSSALPSCSSFLAPRIGLHIVLATVRSLEAAVVILRNLVWLGRKMKGL